MRLTRLTALSAVTVLLAAGCSIANPTSSEVSLQYGAGPFDSRKFVECETARDVSDVNDDHYYYPRGQRDFTFGAGQGLDSAPLTSTTADSQEITVQGTVKFTLNTDCTEFTDPGGTVWPGGRLQMLHELITFKYNAAPLDGGQTMPPGWSEFLRAYLGAALDRATDNEALKYPWQKLYADVTAKAQWEKDVLAQLPAILKSMTQGVDLITVNTVVLQKPGIQPALVQGLTDKQAAELRAQAADVDKLAAANFPDGIRGYQAYQQQQAVNEAIKSGKVQVLPVPQGSSVIVSPK